MSNQEPNELQLKTDAQSVVEQANQIIVNDDAGYVFAGNVRKNIKETRNNIATYWQPKKDAAYRLHKDLVAAEKEMTTPLDQADKIIETRMLSYWRKKEEIRLENERIQREAEAEAARKAEEAARLVAEVADKEELDDDDVSIMTMAQADADRAQLLADSVVVSGPVKMQGVSVVKTWKARVTDDAAVPISINGAMIRPIDLTLLNKFAVMSQGNATIPGVVFYQDESTRVRL